MAVLVTGAAGSIGSELCRQILDYNPALLLALDNNETGLFELVEDLCAHPNAASVQIVICDITDAFALERFFATRQPHIIFHAAAYKHVPLLELHPEQAVRTNVLGTWNLCQAALRYQAQRFIFVSTDKAAEPISVLGSCPSVRCFARCVSAMSSAAVAVLCLRS
jgi:FlaA1/EpsC-like NDP-sugar epimerase